MEVDAKNFVGGLLFCIVVGVSSFTDPNDLKILVDFRDNLENPELLKWPDAGSNGDPCGPPSWPHVFCSNGRVTQIQVQNLGLQGSLPQNLNQLEQLQNVGLQKNKFCGNLPSFSGLSNLQYAYLDFNEFDTIPNDFFNGLSSIRVLALDNNPFNHTYGWTIPSDLAESSQLLNFSCSSCNLVGPVPDFFGNLPSLSALILSYNRLSGPIPSTFRNSMLQTLFLNNQDGGGLNGPIELIVSMLGLSQVWLHGNQFTGMIPAGIGQLTNLRELNLNTNQLVGMIPQSLASMNLQVLDLGNNMLMGPIPEFKAAHVSLSSNSFCLSAAGAQCAPQVSALLEFLEDLDYPVRLAYQWTGNDPCRGPWWGITCDPYGEVSVINLQKLDLNGTLSPALVNLSSLIAIHLEGNNLSGRVPESLTQLRSLRLLKLSGNNIEPPMPIFSDHVEVDVDGNPRFQAVAPEEPPRPAASPPLPQPPSPFTHAPTQNPSPDHDGHHSISTDDSASNQQQNQPSSTRNRRLLVIVSSAAGSTVSSVVVVFVLVYCLRKGKQKKASAHAPAVVHPKDSSSDHSDMLKIPVADVSRTGRVSSAINSRSLENPHAIDAGNLFISLQVLRNVTNNFAPEHELGRGGFGVVYKGQLEDGKNVAVKRMVVGVICEKALDEFQSEITLLSKVRHRNLVSLLGYSVEGTERLLVYEYMPQGALSRHLFRWKSLGLAPLSWAARLNIALDVARGVEYLHNLAHQSFIHRDLKSSNILLDDDFRAKVSDFGLVKLAPDAERSVATRLAGTFGYLAPEYAVTGKITTKVDVFSFGVILIELLTGLVALDEQRPEEIRYLAEWFWQIKSNRDTLIASIDPALDASNEIDETTFSVAELAGHCTSRDPNHRPEMGHAVNVLSRLVEKWKPYEGTDAHTGIVTSLPLSQMLKGWKEEQDTQDFSSRTLDDSKGSIPGKPAGFADSFTSADAR